MTPSHFAKTARRTQRNIFFFLYHWFLIKGKNSRTSKMERCIGPGIGKELRASLPSPFCHSLRISMFFPTWKHSDPCPCGFLWRLQYIGMADETIGQAIRAMRASFVMIVLLLSLVPEHLQSHKGKMGVLLHITSPLPPKLGLY